MLALSNLPCHPYALHSFQEDLFNDLIEHRNEGNQQVVPRVLNLSFLKMGTIFPFFWSLMILPNWCDFSNMMKSGLVTASAGSFKTLSHLSERSTISFVFFF